MDSNYKMKIDETVLDVLENLFNECGSLTAKADAMKFRASNYKYIETINWLENEQYIQRDDQYYNLKLISLYLISDRCPDAQDLIRQCEVIFPHLKQHYLNFTGLPLAITNVLPLTGFSIKRLIRPLSLMCESTIIGGHSTNLSMEGAVVYPAERILSFESFSDVLKEIMSWRSSNHQQQIVMNSFEIEDDEFMDLSPVGCFVHRKRIKELTQLEFPSFDFKKVVQICNEMNSCFRMDNFFALGCLQRMLIDHIPPIFGLRTFAEVTSNYGSKSFKAHMTHLDKSLRKISDSYLHQTIRKSEVLPNVKTVDFSSDIDVLLGEIIRYIGDSHVKY